MTRSAQIHRQTAETQIELELNLDGSGTADVATGVGFFDHMLTLLAKHAAIDLKVRANGDLHVDQHHTVEDTGICLGQALRQALGNKAGIRRYGHFTLPMEETLVTTAIDLSGRYYMVFEAPFRRPRLATSTASWSKTSGKPWQPTPWRTCTSFCITAATAITSAKQSSRPRREHYAWPWNWTRVRRACRARREHCRRVASVQCLVASNQ